MSHCVFILGAGASAAGGCPVMANFFNRARLVYRSHAQGEITTIERDDYEAVERFRHRLGRWQVNAQVDIDNLEQVYSAIEIARLIGMPDAHDLRERFARFVKATLHRTQIIIPKAKIHAARNGRAALSFSDSDIAGVPGHVELCGLIRMLHRHGHTCDIVTFNYDIGLELSAYFQQVPIVYSQEGAPDLANVRTLKLHGSINWYRHLPDTDQEDDFRMPWEGCEKWIEDNLSLVSNVDSHDRLLDVPCNSWTSEKWMQRTPYIVPPSDSKGDLRGYMSELWGQASRTLRVADMVCIVGYSLPDSDAFFRTFLFMSLADREQIERVYIVNPVANDCNRIESMLGSPIRERKIVKKISSSWPMGISTILDDYDQRGLVF